MEALYVLDPSIFAPVKTDVAGEYLGRAFPVRARWSAAQAVAADTDGVLAAVTDTGVAQEIRSGFGALPCPRNVTATAGGTNT